MSHGPCSPLYASCRKAVPGKAARRKLPPAQRVSAALYCCERCCVLRVLRCELHVPRLHAVPRQDAGADWVHQRGGRDPQGAEGYSRVLTRHSHGTRGYSRVLTRHSHGTPALIRYISEAVGVCVRVRLLRGQAAQAEGSTCRSTEPGVLEGTHMGLPGTLAVLRSPFAEGGAQRADLPRDARVGPGAVSTT
jgi:hypothetical protein